MALTVITEPKNYQLSKNPVVLQLQTDAYLLSAGTKATITLNPSTSSGANAVGGVLILNWGGDSVVFTVATTPDDSGYQVRPKLLLTDSQYALQLLADLKKNYTLTQAFDITRSGSNIIITAKQVGVQSSIYDLSSSTDFGYIINASHTDGTDASYAENYKMRADVWMETTWNSNVFENIGSIEKDPLNNVCVFDFQDPLNANLQYNLPEYNATEVFVCDTVIKNFYINYIEKYGSPVTPRQINTSDIGIVLKAGVPTHEFVGTTNLVDNRYKIYSAFLTRQPRTKKVRQGQQEYLYYIIDNGDISLLSINLRVIIYRNDNGADITIDTNIGAYLNYATIGIPVGFNQLELNSYIDFSKVKKYTVQISTLLSETFTFIPETDYFIDEHYLLFTNSDGGFDTARFTGVKETGFETEKERIQKTILFNTPVVSGEFSNINNLVSDKFKLSSGWITKAQSDWLQDLFIAEQVFIIAFNQFMPITITTLSQKKYDSQTNLFYYELEYSYAFQNKVITSREQGS